MAHLYNFELEQSVIFTLISVDNAYEKVAGKLKTNDFYSHTHQVIYQCIESLAQFGQPYDLIMVTNKLMADKKDSSVIDYISKKLPCTVTSIFNLENYTELLIDLSKRRKITECYERATRNVSNFELTPVEAWSLAAEDINLLIQGTGCESHLDTKELMETFTEELKVNAIAGVAPNVKTGLAALDKQAMILNGDMVVIAARPSMGKTTLGQTIATNLAQNEEGVTVFFSLEMSKKSIIKRLVSSIAGVHMNKVFTGQNLEQEDWDNIFIHSQTIEALPLIIDDSSYLTTGQMRSTLNRIRQIYGKIATVIVDYIQLIQATNPKDNREGQIRDISSALKGFAKEFNCPVFALSQLNRGLEYRNDKRPIMSDLRDSGSIEQDADHIIFIYRDEVYNKTSVRDGVAELIVSKQRNGSIGTIKVKFEGEYSRFTDLTSI